MLSPSTCASALAQDIDPPSKGSKAIVSWKGLREKALVIALNTDVYVA